MVRHLLTERLSAAKVLEVQTVGRKFHELNMMKYLHHRALPEILDILEEDGFTWLIMTYIEGAELTDIFQAGIQPELFFRIAKELAGVLIYLHSAPVSILHLDIKPSNILIKKDGQLVLIDFGAAISGEKQSRLDAVFGTRGFAAPEQMRLAGPLDGKTDEYAFGATLLYCLAFEEKSYSNTGKTKCALWRSYVHWILKKCMRVSREKRYPDMEYVYRALERAERVFSFCHHFWGKVFLIFFLSGAFLFLSVGLLADTKVIPGGAEASVDAGQDYNRIMDMAAGLGSAQAAAVYKEAALLFPEADWGLKLLDHMEADFRFTVEEEVLLQEILYEIVPAKSVTLDEVYQKSPWYGVFSYRMGLMYWYFYDDSGGKSAAARWFQRAVEFAEENSRREPAESARGDWEESARIHARISSYYEKIGRRNLEGVYESDLYIYWLDLKELWYLEESRLTPVIRKQVAAELLSVLGVGAYLLYQSGAERGDVEILLDEIYLYIEESKGGEKEENERQYRIACAAVERGFADERRLWNE